MSNIKFRVWHVSGFTKEGKFVTFPEEHVGVRCAHRCMATEQKYGFGTYILNSTENNVIQRFIDFQDKNGRDVYEGDLVYLRNDKSYTAVVSWIGRERGKQYSFTYALVIPGTPYREDFQFLDSSEIEVVGNIFEGVHE